MNNMLSNSDKRDGWVSCRSNKQPERYYYFNTFTGESIWQKDWKNCIQNVAGSEALISSNLSHKLHPETTEEIGDETHSPDDKIKSENLTPSTYENLSHSMEIRTDITKQKNITSKSAISNKFDIRHFLNWRRTLKMELRSTKNTANRRMQLLREQLKLTADALSTDLNRNNNESTNVKSRVTAPSHFSDPNESNFTGFANSYYSQLGRIKMPIDRNMVPEANPSTSKDSLVNNLLHKNRKRRFVGFEESSKNSIEAKARPSAEPSYYNNSAFRNSNSTEFNSTNTKNNFLSTNTRPNDINIAENSKKINKTSSTSIRLKRNFGDISTADNISSSLPVTNGKSNDCTIDRKNTYTAKIPKFSLSRRLQRNFNNTSEPGPSTEVKPTIVENQIFVTNRKPKDDRNNAEHSQKTVEVSNSKFSVSDRLRRNVNHVASNHDKHIELPALDEPLSKIKMNLSRGSRSISHASHPPLNKYFENDGNSNIYESRNIETSVVKIPNSTTTSALNSELAKSCTGSGLANARLKTFRKFLVESTECSNNEDNHAVLTPEDVVMEQNYENNTKKQYTSCSQENMEWETITEEKVLQSVESIRKELLESSFMPEVEYTITGTNEIKDNDGFKPHIVIDTNIFLSHLSFVQHILLDYNFEDLGHPIIIVPWIVLQELDYIKDRQNKSDGTGKLAVLARKAISFLNNSFSSNSPNLYGQNAMESSRELFQIDSSDDKILNCCLQTKEKSQNVFLLSNDQNLRTKAVVSHIPAYSKEEILEPIKKLAKAKNTSHSEQTTLSNSTSEHTEQSRKLASPQKGLNERSAIAKAPRTKRIDMPQENKTHEELDKCLTNTVIIYKQYCRKLMEIVQKTGLGEELDKPSAAIVKALPEKISMLSKILDAIPLVTIVPHYNVKLSSLETFTELVMVFLLNHGEKCASILVKDMGSFCRIERDKILALGKRLECVHQVLINFAKNLAIE